MSRWTKSLIRIANYEVETQQKLLGEIVGRRMQAQSDLAQLAVQAEAEAEHVRQNPASGLSHLHYIAGVRARRTQFHQRLALLDQEEGAAREALTLAFEALKKYEIVAQNIQTAQNKTLARQDGAVLDEMGLRLSRKDHQFQSSDG